MMRKKSKNLDFVILNIGMTWKMRQVMIWMNL